MSQPRLLPAAYTVAWVSALPLESAAAVQMLDEKHCDPRGHGSNTDQYVFGRVGNHNVVMARLPSGQMGNNSAADVAGRLTTNFPSIKFALMVGIGGGVPTASADVRLGDVVVGHPHSQHGGVVQYDFGKTGPNGQVHRTGFINAPPKVLLNAIAKLRENHYRCLNDVPAHLSAFDKLAQFSQNTTGPDFLFQAAYKHSGGDDCESCNKEMIIKRPMRESKEVVIHYGTIASGNQVMKDGMARDRISAELGGVLCFEMEGAGLAGAFPSAVIRGICDYADSHKNKSWQPYAAATAAAFAKELLRVVPAEEVTKTNISGRISGAEKYRVSFSLKGIPRGRFVDRPEEMRRLERALMRYSQAQSEDYRQQVVVLHGLGGIGKTQLAAEFARKHQAAFTSVFWLDGSSEDILKQSIAGCAGRIPKGQIPEKSRKYSSGANGDLKAVIGDFMEWLSNTENKHWLIVFDNVDRDSQQETDINAYNVSNYIPEVDHGLILITTRLANLQQLGESLRVGTVDMSQAQAIFRKWYNQDVDPNDSNELLRLLDGLPLALAQAAAYMNETGASFSTYTRLYKEQWKDLMENDNMAPLRSYGNRSINTTWTVSYNAIRAKNEAAANLLLLWAHLDHKTLPFWILQAGAHRSSALAKDLSAWLRDAATDEVKFLEVVRLLRSYCLIESLHGGSIHGPHPVVHQWAFHIQDTHQRAELSKLAILVIGYAVPDKHATEYHQKQWQLFPHAESCIERMERATADTMAEANEEVSYALHMMGILLSDQGNLGKAEKMYQRALEGFEKAWGPDHTLTLDTVNNLGNLYADQGKLADAEKMYQRALEGYEKSWGPDHIPTLDTINNLGLLYACQGKLADAEKMYQRALEGKEKFWGPDHISTLTTVNNLGLLYVVLGKTADAEKMYQRMLEGKEKSWGSWGPNHMLTLTMATNLNLLYAVLEKSWGN
ncbi:Nephrocystin-3 [Talaromyces pinophilus]|nr:Nephrocystin-3 [Talaromyces pinophilus]